MKRAFLLSGLAVRSERLPHGIASCAGGLGRNPQQRGVTVQQAVKLQRILIGDGAFASDGNRRRSERS